MPTTSNPPRTIEELRKWRAERYEEGLKEEIKRIGDRELTAPRKRVVPTLGKKAKARGPADYPRVGGRAKTAKEQAQKGERGYVE